MKTVKEPVMPMLALLIGTIFGILVGVTTKISAMSSVLRLKEGDCFEKTLIPSHTVYMVVATGTNLIATVDSAGRFNIDVNYERSSKIITFVSCTNFKEKQSDK